MLSLDDWHVWPYLAALKKNQRERLKERKHEHGSNKERNRTKETKAFFWGFDSFLGLSLIMYFDSSSSSNHYKHRNVWKHEKHGLTYDLLSCFHLMIDMFRLILLHLLFYFLLGTSQYWWFDLRSTCFSYFALFIFVLPFSCLIVMFLLSSSSSLCCFCIYLYFSSVLFCGLLFLLDLPLL